MQIKVLKFGGSSLADAKHFEKVAEIVKSDSVNRYVVASAPGKRFDDDEKVTDLLYACYALASKKQDITEVFSKIRERYNHIIDDLNIDFSLDNEFERIQRAIEDHAGRDYVASRGEYLNAKVLAKFLGYAFVDADEGIFFSDNGMFDAETTNKTLADVLDKHEYAVIPGFYGSMPNGTIKTFSRGGSDITGSIVSRAVCADIYENWTDVSGMLMADPRKVKSPKAIDVITYKELRELSYMGATVLHEDAIFPVREAAIPINIKNTNAPCDKGTMIVPETDIETSKNIITGVAGKVGFSTITVEKDQMNSEVGFGRKMLEVLEKHKLSFEHLPSGIDTMSVVVATETIEKIKDDITAELIKVLNPDVITIEDGMALIAVVGRGMVKVKGTASRIFKAIAEASVNIKMIDQGSSEFNIIIGVDESDYITTLNAIYSEFVK